MQRASPLASSLPNLDGFLEELSGAQFAAFGKSHLGARERARAAHLVQTLCGTDQPPASIRGALRASLSGSEAEADLFDAVWLRSRLATELQSASSMQIDGQTDPSEQAEKVAPARSRLTIFNLISIVAAVFLIVGLGFALTTMIQGDEVAINEQAPLGVEGVPEAAQRLTPSVDTAAPAAAVSSERSVNSDNQQVQLYEIKARALLELSAKYDHRPSPRQLALVLSRSSLGGGRSEPFLAREIAKATGKGPDDGIDMLAPETLVRILTVLGEPPVGSVRSTEQLAGPISEAKEQFAASLAQPLIYESTVSGAALSPDQKHILTWSEDNTARVWDFATGLPVGAPLQHDEPVIGAQFIESGARILTLSGNKALLWNLASEARIVGTFEHDTPVVGAAIAKDAEQVLTWTADAGLQLWNVKTGRLTGASEESLPSLSGASFSDDGSRVLTWRASEGRKSAYLQFGPTEDLVISRVGSAQGTLLAASWSIDGTRVIERSDESVVIWDADTYEVLSQRIDPEPVLGAVISKNGDRILAWGNDNVARLSDAETGDFIGTGLTHPREIEGAVLSDDGSHILTWSADRIARLWEAGTGKQIGPDLPHASLVSSASLSINGSRVFTLSDDGTVRRWSPRGVSDPAALGEARRKSSVHPLWPALLMAAIPVLIVGIALARPAAWRRAYLRRRRFEPGSLLKALSAQLRNSAPLLAERRAVAQLDRRHRAPSRRLDARETALASARANGFFTPVTDTDAGTAEYVALIERRRRGDADAMRMTAFFERLRKSGLMVSVYSYSGTPEALTPARNLRPITLETLKHRHRGAYLLVSGEPQAFHDTEAGGAASWTRRIGRIGRDEDAAWSGAALLAPAGAEIPAFLARILNTDLSIAIRPAIAAGLNGLAQTFDKGPAANPLITARTSIERMPEFLASDPSRLMRETPRYPIDQQRLVFELEDWVGATGLIWLRALAYYPIVQWDLARCLRDLLLPDLSSEEREILESKVARLVWLEQGYMPDWVRQALIATNDPQSEKHTIELLTQIMTAAQSGEQGQVTFELGGRKDGRAAAHPADALFIDAVSRTRVRPWDLPPPPAWQTNMPSFIRLPWVRLRVAIAGIVFAASTFFLVPQGSGAPVSEWLPISVFLVGVACAMLVSALLAGSHGQRRNPINLSFDIRKITLATLRLGPSIVARLLALGERLLRTVSKRVALLPTRGQSDPQEISIKRETIREDTVGRNNDPITDEKTSMEAETSTKAREPKALSRSALQQIGELSKAVARVTTGSDSNSRRTVGTGFLLDGGLVTPKLRGEVLFLTCACVVSETNPDLAVRPGEAWAFFDVAPELGELPLDDLLWSSPAREHDVSIFRLRPRAGVEDQLKAAASVIKVAHGLPKLRQTRNGEEEPNTILIIGYPLGGEISFSIDNSELIDYEDVSDKPPGPEPRRIHYRAPTEKGSAGSPVFNSRTLELIGIHHSGGNLRRLNGAEGTHDAKEGLWIQPILEAFRRESNL